jgi:hypothetical protein
MPELMIDFITSLDGYGSADGWPGWWGLEGPQYLAWLGEQPEADYTIPDGREHLSTHVRAGDPRRAGYGCPGGPVEDRLFEHPREPLSWANTRLVAEDAVEAVAAMKHGGTESMRTIGSRHCAASC